MLLGQSDHKVDDKGRVFIPAKFRDELGSEFVLVNGFEKCLYVFSGEEWMKFANKLSSLPLSNTKIQKFTQKLMASASEVRPDKQGRVLITSKQREYAGISGEVVINGAMTRATIWDKAEWEKYSDSDAEEYEAALEELSGLGI